MERASSGIERISPSQTVAHSPRKFALLLTALMAAELTCSLESNMIYVALSLLYREYGDPVRVNWILTAFMLTSCGSAAIVGRLGDIMGRRRMMIIMLLIATMGSLLSALSQDLTMIIVGRGLQGATMGILPLCYGMLRQHCDEKQITRGIALMGAVYVFGSGIGVILGGVIVDLLNWQWIFAVSAVMGLAALALVIRFVPKTHERADGECFDLVGMLLFIGAMTAILLGCSWLAAANGAGGVAPGALIAAGSVLVLTWVRHELRHPTPFIDIRLLSHRPILLTNLCILFTAAGPMMHPAVMMPFMQQPTWTGTGLGLPASFVGMLKLPAIGAQICILIGCGYMATRYGTWRVVATAAAALTGGWIVMSAHHDSFTLVAALFALILAPGSAVMFTMIPRLIMESVPEDMTSEATGLTQSIRALGQTFSAQIMGFLLATSLVTNPSIKGAFPSDSAYTLAFIAMASLSLAALLSLLAITAKRRSRRVVDLT
ncbi:MAG: hypothetical protein JWR80_6560 [Bradyrhizobium sp.]|nr:hypothetical protein [Bradyrhizobium sp.]